jgi:glycosyltransferase involved in cell wall biosynthesis
MRLLVISHVFPPSVYSNAKRPSYLVKGFLKAGWDVDVLTSTIGLSTPVKETLTHPKLRINRIADPAERFCRKFARHPFLYRMIALTTSGLTWPDANALWSRRAIRAAQNTTSYDRVLVFIFPASLLLLGRTQLVKQNWIFDFQESVTPNWRLYSRRSPINRIGFPSLVRLERTVLHQAGRVIFTAQSNREAYQREGLVGPTPTEHVPYFYDADAFKEPTEPISKKFQISYLGAFDWRGARSPETFLRSLAKFLDATPAARPHTNFQFHGNWLSEHNCFITELELSDVVSIGRSVPYEEYLKKIKQSPILLLIVSSEHNLFMPSKVVDYFGVRRPILAFVPRESEMRRVLEAADMAHYTCDEADIDAGATALAKLWTRYKLGTLDRDEGNTTYWSSEVQIPRYLDLVAQTQ